MSLEVPSDLEPELPLPPTGTALTIQDPAQMETQVVTPSPRGASCTASMDLDAMILEIECLGCSTMDPSSALAAS